MQLHKTDINANNTVNTDCILFEALDEILENLNCEIESCIVDARKKGANCDQAVVSMPKTVRRRLTTVVWKNTLALTPVRFHALTGPKIIRQRNQLFLTDMSIDKTYFFYQVLPC